MPGKSGVESADCPPSSSPSGQSRGNERPDRDPVEAALAAALERASVVGEWAVVAELARQLEARRRERVAPDVAELDVARDRKAGAP